MFVVFSPFFENINIKVFVTVILPVVLYSYFILSVRQLRK
jgi:hypothetical protein